MRPAELPDQLTRQPERKIESADPGPIFAKQLLEAGEILDSPHALDRERAAQISAFRAGDRLGAARATGEVNTEYTHSGSRVRRLGFQTRREHKSHGFFA